jgi:hypothetical protein
VWLDHNQFTGTVPPSYAAISNVSLAYNPLLVGPVPPLLALGSVLGSSLNTIGTSLGLDWPLAAILADVRAALDPSGGVLGGWNASASVQPCAPYSGQRSGRLGYGGSWTGVTCSDGTAFAPMTLFLDSLPYLAGTVPLRLRELRTATSIKLQRNPLLGGTLPAAWGANVTWSNFPTPTPGFDNTEYLYLWANNLTGALPPALLAVAELALGTQPPPPAGAPLPAGAVRPTQLFLSNADADAANKRELDALPSPLLLSRASEDIDLARDARDPASRW